MSKINQEEYEVLKGLGDKWKWIARDESGSCFIFELKPIKDNRYELWEWVGNTNIDKIFDSSLFQFIQWEDSEPYNIQELIEEYESEETEVKKDLEWLKKEIDELFNGRSILIVGKSVLDEKFNQLDEPETPTKWRLGKRIGHQEVIQLGKLLEEKENLERKLYVTKKEINQLYGKYNLDKTN